MHPGWPTSSQWSQDDNEYDEDDYVIGARIQNWQDEAWNATHWQGDIISYNFQRGGPWRSRASIVKPKAL